MLRAYRNQIARCRHKTDANGHPVEMRLTFEQWSEIWKDSGHWDQRGTRKGCYCMSRINDIGHYELGNVVIQLHSQNSSDTDHTGQPASFGMLGKFHQSQTLELMSHATRGANNPIAKLTEDQVREIKISLSQGTKHQDLANAYHVTKPTISAIATGRNWKHVTI